MANRARDHKNLVELNSLGYRQLTIWECAMRDKSQYYVEEIVEEISCWLVNGSTNASIQSSNLGVDSASKKCPGLEMDN